jgi:uracil-DNA glycosylase
MPDGPPVRPRPGPDERAGAGPRTSAASQLAILDDEIVACRACPRLVEWREEVARTKVARFATDDYWGRPVPGLGDPEARVLVLGLAPAAHGGNRTGRVFTGDRSGDVLFAALHGAGYASQPTSVRRGDGLTLTDCRVAAAVRCAPPGNRPTPDERDRCLPFLEREIAALGRLRVIVALGAFGWDAALRALAGLGAVTRPRPRFGHGAEARVGDIRLLGCYHPSQQNTFTGRVTPAMIDAVLERARGLAASPDDEPSALPHDEPAALPLDEVGRRAGRTRVG